jgi:hypothetical protein
VTDTPLYADVVTDLADDPLADCPPSGPLRPEDEPCLFDAVTLPTLAALDDEQPDCECDDCLAPAPEAVGRPMVTLQPRGEYL